MHTFFVDVGTPSGSPSLGPLSFARPQLLEALPQRPGSLCSAWCAATLGFGRFDRFPGITSGGGRANAARMRDVHGEV